MTKREMVYEIAKATNTTSGKLARAGKVDINLDRIAKKNSFERTKMIYDRFITDIDHAKFYFSIL